MNVLFAMDRQIVHADPEIMGGELVFVGTRVPVKSLFEQLQGGDSLEMFLADFPSVSKEQALAVLEMACEALESIARSAR